MEVAECIGGPSLAGVMRLLAQDHAGWAGVLLALCSCLTCNLTSLLNRWHGDVALA